jgi:uncharacterized protein with FMN-binding domain
VPAAGTPRPAAPTIHASNPVPVRALLAIAGTILGLALLFSFRTPDAIPVTAGGLRAGAPTPDPSRPVTGAVARATPGATAVPAAPAVVPSTPAGTNVPGSTTRPPTSAPTPAPTARAAAADVTGPIERTPYGNVQVEVKLNARQIVDVVALQLPNDRRRSAEISQYVEPILHEEALQAQSAQIDLISGATWTSGAYQASLESALSQAGIQ